MPENIKIFISNLSLKSWRYLNKKTYLQGVLWIIIVSFISNMNDILMRFLGERLPSMEISFFRFFFAMIILLPIMLYKGSKAFKTGLGRLHIIRSLVGFLAISFWCYGVGKTLLSVVSTIALTIPLFILPMTSIFLNERVGWPRSIATIFGFLGVLIIIWPNNIALSFNTESFNFGIITLITAALLFALSDIINKKMTLGENSLAMLFYFALGTTLAGFIPTVYVWKTPYLQEFFYLFLLGIGGNLILYCLLKAFAVADVSALSPYRYIELLFAIVFGYIIFEETPKIHTFLGIAIIVCSTFMITVYEKQKRTIL